MSVPSAAWFQQAAHSKGAKDALIQHYHINGNGGNEIHQASYANTNRAEKISTAIRDSLERNSATQITSIERNSAEGRAHMLHTYTDEAHQEADNFEKVLLASKDNRIAQAQEVSQQEGSGLKSAIDFEFEILDSVSADAKNAIRNLRIQSATNTLDVMDTATQNNGAVLANIECKVAKVELAQLAAQHDAEKNNTFLAIQAEQTHGDTNLRLALDRARNDERVEAVTAAATLQEAEARTKVLLYEIETSGATARAAFQAKQLLKTTTAETEQVVAASSVASARDALAAARAEAAMYRSKPRRD
jgi:hypothetical protein